MTSPSPPDLPPKRTFFSRHFAPLIGAWVAAIVVVGLIYWFERAMPAFDEVVAPLYAVTALLLAAFTWRWIRTRGKGERRNRDRRRTDRRNTAEYSTKPPET
jgi:hypothetical protein